MLAHRRAILVLSLVAAPLALVDPAPARADALVPGSPWGSYAAPTLVAGSTGSAAAIAGDRLLVTETEGVHELDASTGRPRSDFGRDGFVDTGYVPSGTPFDVSARPGGGAYVLLTGARRLRLWHGADEPTTVGLVALTATGDPEPAYPDLAGYGAIGTRYLGAGTGSAITDIGAVVTTSDDAAVVSYVADEPGEVTPTDPAPASRSVVELRRVLPDGSIDASFADGGRASWTFPDQLEPGHQATVTVDRMVRTTGGALLVLVRTDLVDTHQSTVDKRLRVIRFTAAGDLDPTFGTEGALLVPAARPMCAVPRSTTGISSLSLRPDGGFVVASAEPVDDSGASSSGGCQGGNDYAAHTQLLLNAFRADGTVDNAFSGDGILRYRFHQQQDGFEVRPDNDPSAVLVDRLGRIVVSDARGGNGDGAVVRFAPDGALDTGFGAAAGVFGAPGSGDLLEVGDDYVAPESATGRRVATLMAGTGADPSPVGGPTLSTQAQPRLRTSAVDRPTRPGDSVTAGTGAWSGVPVDHVEVTLLGCEPRLLQLDRCRDLPLARTSVASSTPSVTFGVPATAAGQYLYAQVTAVGVNGRRTTVDAYGVQVGSSGYLSPDEVPRTIPDIEPAWGAGQQYLLPDGTLGEVHFVGYSSTLRIVEQAPDEAEHVVLTTELDGATVVAVKTAPDGTAHLLVRAHGNLWISDRAATGAWSAPVQLTDLASTGGGPRAASLVAAAGGRAVVAWAEDAPRTDGRTAPVGVRVRDTAGWGPLEYLDQARETTCPPVVEGCDPDQPPGIVGAPYDLFTTINDSGEARVLFDRGIDFQGYGYDSYTYEQRRSPSGVWADRARLKDIKTDPLIPLGMATLGDGSALVLLNDVHGSGDTYRQHLVVQRVAQGSDPLGRDAGAVPGATVATYENDENTSWDNQDSYQPPLFAVDGTHWRLAYDAGFTKAGRNRSQVMSAEGSGGTVLGTAVLDRRTDVHASGDDWTFVAGPSGRALLVTGDQAGFDGHEYSVADGNGPMRPVQPLLEHSLYDTDLASLTPPRNQVFAGSLTATFRNGSWQVALLGQAQFSKPVWQRYRLTHDLGAPSVRVPSDVVVRPHSTFDAQAVGADPDGLGLGFAWDLDADGRFDDASGQSVTLMAGDAFDPIDVAVRTTAADGDRSIALQTFYPAANTAPSIASLDGPSTAQVGTPAQFTVTAYDQGDLTYRWSVNGATVASQTTDTATLSLPAGSDTVTVRVTDSEGLFSEASAGVTVTEPGGLNHAPVITLSGPAKTFDGMRATYRASAQDADGDTLALVWKVDGRVLPSLSGNQLSVVLRKGRHEVTVQASDATTTTSATRSVATSYGSMFPDEPVVPVGLSGAKRLDLEVTVPGRGRVTVTVTRPGSKTVWGAGKVASGRRGAQPVAVTLTSAGVRALKAAGAHVITVTASFAAGGHSAVKRTQTITVIR